MGNNVTQSTHKTKYQDHIFMEQLGEGRTLMRNRITKKEVVIVQHTFSCEQLLNDYIAKNKNTMSIQHQFYLNAFDY